MKQIRIKNIQEELFLLHSKWLDPPVFHVWRGYTLVQYTVSGVTLHIIILKRVGPGEVLIESVRTLSEARECVDRVLQDISCDANKLNLSS